MDCLSKGGVLRKLFGLSAERLGLLQGIDAVQSDLFLSSVMSDRQGIPIINRLHRTREIRQHDMHIEEQAEEGSVQKHHALHKTDGSIPPPPEAPQWRLPDSPVFFGNHALRGYTYSVRIGSASSELRRASSIAHISMVKILLVEDNAVDAQLAQDILSDWNADQFEVVHVTDLKQALAALGRDRFQAVLLDLSLPDGHGLATLQEVQGTSPGIPIVVLSGFADQAAALQAVQQGAQDYLVKGQIQGDLLARSIRYAIERKRTEERLTYLAQYDQLTGLVNRALFRDRLEQAVVRARRTNQGFALLLLDLDRFKAVNDTLGHDAGDAVLKIVAERLKSCVREVDTVARMGGDEFTVILEGTASEAGAETVAKRIVQTLAQPCAVSDRQVSIGTSIGGTLFPQDQSDLDDLLKHADSAMYQAKHRGGDTFVLFAPVQTPFPSTSSWPPAA